ncbi:MAG: Multidrug ABC transporter ATP-binding protein, partial [Halothiobacillaceae bacterium]
MAKGNSLVRLLRYSLTERKALLQALLLMVVATAADVSCPLLIKQFIDETVIPGELNNSTMVTFVLSYLALVLCASVTHYWQAIKLNRVAISAVQRLREELFARVLHLPMRYFDHTPTGSLISRITNDTETIKELYINVLGVYAGNVALMLGIFVAMALLDWRLMLICLLLVPVVAVFMLLYQRLSTPLFHQARALLSDINAQLHEVIQGMKIIQLMGQAPRFQRHFATTTERHLQARLRNVRIDSLLLRPLIDLLHALILVLLIFSFGYQSLSSVVEVGVVYAFINYLGRFIEPLIE